MKKVFSWPKIKDDQCKQYLFWNTGNGEITDNLLNREVVKLLITHQSSSGPPGKNLGE